MHLKPLTVSNFRNFIFGVEDSLVSTVGLLSGVAVAGMDKDAILLTGIVLILVEAISMAAGSYLSEHSAKEYETQREVGVKNTITSGVVMFFSYFVSGFIPLAPYIYWPPENALWLSICFSIGSLFILGLVSAKMSKTNLIRNAIEMTVIGGIAIGAGSLAGNIISSLN